MALCAPITEVTLSRPVDVIDISMEDTSSSNDVTWLRENI